MSSGLRDALDAELARTKAALGAEAREERRRRLVDAWQRNDFAFDRADHNIAFGERIYLTKCGDAWTAMQTAIDAWHAAPGPDPLASARSLALRFRRAARVGPLSFMEDPRAAWIRIETAAAEPEPPGDLVPRLVAMYRRWSAGRGFAMQELSTGEPVGGALLCVEGPGAYGALKTETGEHRISTIESGQDGRAFTVRIEVEIFADGRTAREHLLVSARPGPVAARHDTLLNLRQEWDGGISLWAHLEERDPRWTVAASFLAAAMTERAFERLHRDGSAGDFHVPSPLPIAREYALAPTPRVRDGWSGIETRDVHAVLAGEIERFLDGPPGESGDPF